MADWTELLSTAALPFASVFIGCVLLVTGVFVLSLPGRLVPPELPFAFGFIGCVSLVTGASVLSLPDRLVPPELPELPPDEPPEEEPPPLEGRLETVNVPET